MFLSSHGKIRKRIEEAPENEVFALSDFSDIVDQKTASTYLGRLSKVKYIKKLFSGIFCKSGSCPSINDVARAIAKRNLWIFTPSGNTALYLLGLRKEKPEMWVYVTDGTYRTYSYQENTISFTHTTEKLFPRLSEKTRLLVQVLKAYGEDHINDDILSRIKEKLGNVDRKLVISETPYMSDWVRKAVRKMYGNNSKE